VRSFFIDFRGFFRLDHGTKHSNNILTAQNFIHCKPPTLEFELREGKKRGEGRDIPV